MARLIFALLCLLSPAVYAADPLTLTADTALEWHRDQQKIIARGNVTAIQGESKIQSALMTADYTEGGDKNKFLPKTLRAENDVRISTPDGTAYGDVALYDIGQKNATLTGENLRLESDNFKLEANDRFSYNIQSGNLSAHGRAKLTQTTDKTTNTIEADSLTAHFIKTAGKNRDLEKMTATGNVIITTPTEVITGDQGFYNKQTNQAELRGNVKILRGPNELTGSLASIDLVTNISTLSGGANNKGQVSGVFYPE